MYRFQVISTLEGNINAGEYRKLVEACIDATVFNDWPWFSTCVESLERESCFQGVTVRTAEDELVGFLGLKVVQERLHKVPARVARFVQYPLGDRIAILFNPDHLDAWEPLLQYLNDGANVAWDCMIWNEWTDTQGLLDRAQRWAKSKNIYHLHRSTSQCPILKLNVDSEQAMVASYSSKMRSDLKRRKKKLQQLNSDILHIRPTPEQAGELVDQMKRTEAASWKGDEGVGIFNDSNTHAFFKTVSQRLAASDQLDLSLVNIDGELASYKYGFYFRNTFFDYSIGYLPQYSKIGLGRILLDELVLAAVREGYAAVDASRVGAVTQHLLFERTHEVVEHYRFYWFSKSLKGRLLFWMIAFAKPQLKILRGKYRAWQQSKGVEQGKAEK